MRAAAEICFAGAGPMRATLRGVPVPPATAPRRCPPPRPRASGRWRAARCPDRGATLRARRASGAALVDVRRRAWEIYVGYRSANPDQTQPFSRAHYNFAITIESAFGARCAPPATDGERRPVTRCIAALAPVPPDHGILI